LQAVGDEDGAAAKAKVQGRWGLLKGAMAFRRGRTFSKKSRSSKSSSSLPAATGVPLPAARATARQLACAMLRPFCQKMLNCRLSAPCICKFSSVGCLRLCRLSEPAFCKCSKNMPAYVAPADKRSKTLSEQS